MTEDILAHRYASTVMREIWDTQNRTMKYQRLWIDVMEAQRARGVDISVDQIDAYRSVADSYRDDDEYRRGYDQAVGEAELRTRHDLKAHLEVLDYRAGGHGVAHLGMTSCDVTETVTEHQVIDALSVVRQRIAATLHRLAWHAKHNSAAVVVARTHHQPAQLTLLGVRFARCAEELLIAYANVADLQLAYPRRGIRGAVGNHVDMGVILGGADKALALSGELDLDLEMTAVGQTPSRAVDAQVASTLLQVASGPGTLATTLRLMAGAGQAYERPADGQVGSSAMPHKRNPRYLERVQGFLHILRGYQTMVSSMVGVTWFEGDVTDSVTRRVALPGMFYTIDGLLQTFCYALDRLGFSYLLMAREREAVAERTATGRLLAAEVALGTSREEAHEALRVLATPEAETSGFSLAERVGRHARLKLDADAALELINEIDTGTAVTQIEIIDDLIGRVLAKHPEVDDWQPEIDN